MYETGHPCFFFLFIPRVSDVLGCVCQGTDSLICLSIYRTRAKRTMGHKSHDPSFHEKYMESGVMTFAAHCTRVSGNSIPVSVFDLKSTVSRRWTGRFKYLSIQPYWMKAQ